MIMWFKSKAIKRELEAQEHYKKLLADQQIKRARSIGIEQSDPENSLWLAKSPGIYFDGHKIIIKSNYSDSIVKSIKGMQQRVWEPSINAWICPVGEYSNVLGIARRFGLPLDETFANIHNSTDVFVDSSIPGSNAHMVSLHNDGIVFLSDKRVMKSDEGYVYLIHATDNRGLYKIGKSKTPDKRVRTVIGQMPMKCEAVHCAWFEDHGYAEKLLHDLYAAKRANSEWFRLSPSDVSFIMSIGQKYDLNPTDQQIRQRQEMEDKRNKNYRQFKQRENRRSSQSNSRRRHKNNPNTW